MWIARSEGDSCCHLFVYKPTKVYDKYQRRWKWEIEPYPSELGESKEYIVPKLERMINECSRFKQMLEEVELKLIEK